ncbi:MAG: anti-sigma factor [Synechococcus sp.]
MSERDRVAPLSEQEQLLIAGFVLGDLTAEETARLKQLATSNPEIRREIRAMQTSLEVLPQALPLASPPPSLRQRIVAAAPAAVEAIPTPADIASVPSRWRLTRRAPALLKLLAALGGLFALLLAADNLRLRSQLQLAREDNLEQVATILQQPTSRLISLEGDQNGAAGTLLFTPGNWSEVIVSLGNLPPLPPERIYRMWLSLDNGDAILCGEFNTESDGSVFVRFTPPESPPEGVKATELYVTQEALDSIPRPQAERVMEGLV